MKHAKISSIYHQANSPAPVGQEAQRRNFEARKQLWHQLGVAVIDPTQVFNDIDREHVQSIATGMYGKRKGN
ncbi:hypothetical protein QEZ52_00380 [Aliisedimentitalea scapharcae]|uniref:Uncharacterized protein n=1 Tax=Aliisedimentitalea scapharcae TaxID=1524259 RepID=A0ABZ2XW71_9RHOB